MRFKSLALTIKTYSARVQELPEGVWSFKVFERLGKIKNKATAGNHEVGYLQEGSRIYLGFTKRI